jgi:hypothetical protein
MSAINVNSITGRTGSHGPVLTGVTTISGDLHVGSGLSVTGVSTFSNTVVGGATTELVVGGDAHITGSVQGGTASFLNISAGANNGFHVDGGAPASSLTVNNLGNTVVGSGHSLYLTNGNLVFSTSGTGIDFSATADGSGTVTSELLDDYEEGTFTPEYEGGTTAGSFTYATNLGIYTKIGRQVFVEIILTNITEVTAGSGTLFVTGLPFADTISHSVGSVRFDNFTFAAGTNYVVPVRAGNTRLQFQEVKSGEVDSAMGVNDRGSDLSDIFVSYSYYVD